MTDHDGTPRSGSTHLDPDVLAELDEELLHPVAAAAARTHLETCAQCRSDLAALAGFRSQLAASGTDEPMPVDVVARLDAALAAEAAGAHEISGTDESAAAEESSGARTVVPLHAPERAAPRGMRVLQAAAVIVLLLAGGALGVSALQGSGGNDGGGSSSSAAGSAVAPKAAEGGFPVTASGHDWDATTLAAAAPRLAAGTFGPAYESNLRSAPSPTTTASTPAGSAADSAKGSARSLVDAPAGRLSGGRALADCVAALTGAGGTPLAVDLATFKGQPAAVILLPPLSGDPDKVDIWVVGADCGPGADKTLYYASVPRS